MSQLPKITHEIESPAFRSDHTQEEETKLSEIPLEYEAIDEISL